MPKASPCKKLPLNMETRYSNTGRPGG